MGNQDSLFSPQEQTSRQEDTFKPYQTPSEQQSPENIPSGAEQAYYESGYSGPEPGTSWMGEEKLRPAKRRRSIGLWEWLALILALLIMAYVAWTVVNFILSSIFIFLTIAVIMIAISQFSARAIPLPPQVFTLAQGRPKLILRNMAGSIHIHPGPPDRFEVSATKYVNGWFGSSNEGTVDFRQDAGSVSVTSRSNYRWSPLGGLRNVNFEITMPANGDIQIECGAGSLTILGIHGQISATTSAGTIDVQQATLENQSNLTTSAGTIHMQQVDLRGQVRAVTSAGTINFSGTIDPLGQYRLMTSAGTVDVWLPVNSSFNLVASATVGTVNNGFGSPTVGPTPQPRLEVMTSVGSITIHRV